MNPCLRPVLIQILQSDQDQLCFLRGPRNNLKKLKANSVDPDKTAQMWIYICQKSYPLSKT
jgi:hypothetical protein